MEYLPTYAVSNSLTNSSHIDSDASRSFAVFYQKERPVGKGWFLFPNHGLAIECSDTPLVIGWDGRIMKHCSATIEPGIVSFFGSSKGRVNDHCVALNLLQKKRSYRKSKFKDGIKVGTIVYVRKKVKHMKGPATTKECSMLNKPMIRKAVVVLADKNKAMIRYLGNLRDVTESIDMKHLILCKEKNSN